MKEILDTRFFFEHFASSEPATREKTRNKLRELRRNGDGILPTVVLAELVDHTCRRAGRNEARQVSESLLVSGLLIHSLTPAIAVIAGGLKCSHRDVPLADCVIAATAINAGGKVVTNDPHFMRFKQIKLTWI